MYEAAFHGHVAQDEPSVGSKAAAHTPKEVLRVGVMVETLRTDDDIKRRIGKRQVLAVAAHEGGVGQVFCFGHLNHFRGEIDANEVLVRKFHRQQRQHRRGAATRIKQVVERLFLDFFEDVGVVFLADVIHPGVVAFVAVGGSRELVHRERLELIFCFHHFQILPQKSN